MERWSQEQANAWWNSQKWICGFNFLPSSAVNFLEMWHPETFDPTTIERELGWAAEIGFNALRINHHYLVWKHDRDGLLQRFDWVMGVADRLGLKTVPCLFDDCGFGGNEPVYGPQPKPIDGVHNSRAVASPGRALLAAEAEWDGLEAYVRDLISAFADDERILFWDLYNEPGNRMVFGSDSSRLYQPDFTPYSLRLLQDSFRWARAEAPSQPITVAAWETPLPGSSAPPYQSQIDQTAISLSDLVTFHAYWDAPHVEEFINHLRSEGRPMLCTEWMARPIGSRIDDQLRLFKDENVGCFQWGLVQGRTQTHLPWPNDLVEAHGGIADRSVWFHDLLHSDGRPYSPEEVATVGALMR